MNHPSRVPTCNLTDVEYKVNGPTRSFKTGEKIFRLTTSSNNSTNLSNIEGFADVSLPQVLSLGIRLSLSYLLDLRTTTQTRINEQQTNLISC